MAFAKLIGFGTVDCIQINRLDDLMIVDLEKNWNQDNSIISSVQPFW